MVYLIRSGMQSGVDLAGADWAYRLGIPFCGYVPKGRKAEYGRVPDNYKVIELETDSYRDRTVKNLTESDFSLILYYDEIKSGTKLTRDLCVQNKKPYVTVDLKNCLLGFKGREYLDMKRYYITHCLDTYGRVNIAGPRESRNTGIYDLATVFLNSLNYEYHEV